MLPLLLHAERLAAAPDPDASECTVRLARDERLVHDLAVARVAGGATADAAVRAAAVALVREGRLPMRAAPKAARAAARCLVPRKSKQQGR